MRPLVLWLWSPGPQSPTLPCPPCPLCPTHQTAGFRKSCLQGTLVGLDTGRPCARTPRARMRSEGAGQVHMKAVQIRDSSAPTGIPPTSPAVHGAGGAVGVAVGGFLSSPLAPRLGLSLNQLPPSVPRSSRPQPSSLHRKLPPLPLQTASARASLHSAAHRLDLAMTGLRVQGADAFCEAPPRRQSPAPGALACSAAAGWRGQVPGPHPPRRRTHLSRSAGTCTRTTPRAG